MITAQIDEPVLPTKESTERKPLRLWPGIVGAALVALGWFVVPAAIERVAGPAMLTGVFGALVIAVWWLVFSRARWFERLGAVVLIIFALIGTNDRKSTRLNSSHHVISYAVFCLK